MTLIRCVAIWERRSRFRAAGTLIELMVGMGIMSVMACALLPAVQGSRETARANSCRHNLMQIGRALLNYESNHRRFPKGAEGRIDPSLSPVAMYGLSWWVDTLPHLEMEDVAGRIDRIGANTGWPKLNSHNGEAADGFKPSSWFCPSTPLDIVIGSGDFEIALPSYTGIAGATNHDGFTETRVNVCCGSDGQISAGGMLVPNAFIRTRQITDGLSKTLVVGEQSDFALSTAGRRVNIGPAFALGWLAGTKSLGVPPQYGSWLNRTYNLTTIRYALNEHRFNLPGIDEDRGANNPLLSAHGDIVNVLYCDGSVHGLDSSMEIVILKSLATRDDGEDVGP